MRNTLVLILVFLMLLPSVPVSAVNDSEILLGVTVLSSYAGFFESPREIPVRVVVTGTSQVFTVDDFMILVGEKPAEIVSLVHEELDFDKHLYVLGIIPPKQEFPGKYDLHVILPVNDVTLKDSITYSGKNVDIVFLIDGSSSMKKNDPRGIRKEGVKLLLSKLDFGDSVAIVEFDSDVHVLFPLSTIGDEGSLKRAIESVDRIGAQGMTNIQEALDTAYDFFLNSLTGNDRKVVILLTDGYNTVGTLNETGIIRKFQRMGWSIYTIALTGDADEELLKKLAEETGGIYMKANNAEDLISMYNSIKTSVKNEVSLKSESGKIGSGEVKEGEIPIGDYVKSFEITVIGKGIDLYLYLPDGERVELDENSPTGTVYENIYYIRSEGYQFYRVINPHPGLWKYRIVASVSGRYHLSASANAPLSIIPDVKVFPENGTVVVSGRLLRNGTVVKTASVDVVLSGTLGKRTLPAGFVEEYSIGGTDFLNSYIVVVHLDSGNYSVRLIARMPDGTVVNSETLNFRVGFEEIYRGEGYIVATDGVSRTYLLNFKREILWSYETGRPRVAHIHHGLVAVGSTRIYMFNITGEPLWDYQFNSSVTAVTIGDEHVAVAVGMKVYLFTLDGRPLWERQLPPENGRVERVYLVEDRTEIRVYVVQEKETTVIDEGGEVVGTIEIPDVRSIVRLVSEAVEEVVDVILDAANTIHVLSGSGEFSIISIPTGEDVTVVLPGEIKIEDEYRDYIAVGTSNGVMIYDLRGNEIGGTSTEDAVIKLVFYKEYLIAGTRNGGIYVLLVKDGTVVKEFQTGSELVDMSVVELEDGAYILAKCLDGIHMFKIEKNIYWARTYGWGEAYTAAIAPNGDIIVAGYTRAEVKYGIKYVIGEKAWIIKLDANGNIKWEKTLNGSKVYTAAIAPNGDIVIVTNADMIVQLDTNGVIKRQRPTLIHETATIVIVQNGSIIVTEPFSIDVSDANGNAGCSISPGGESSAVTPDGGIVIVRSYLSKDTITEISKFYPMEHCIRRVWTKTWRSGWANDVAVAPNGDIIVVGHHGDDLWALKLDADGNVKWQKTYGGSKCDEANAVTIASNGDVIVAGYTYSFGAGGEDVWLLRLDENGNVKWQKTYGGSNDDWANAVALADNEDIIVAGRTESFSDGDGSAWVLRLSPDGNLSNCNFCRDSNAQVMNINISPERNNETNGISWTSTSAYTPSNNKKVCGPAVFVILSVLLALLERRRS